MDTSSREAAGAPRRPVFEKYSPSHADIGVRVGVAVGSTVGDGVSVGVAVGDGDGVGVAVGLPATMTMRDAIRRPMLSSAPSANSVWPGAMSAEEAGAPDSRSTRTPSTTMTCSTPPSTGVITIISAPGVYSRTRPVAL